MESNDYNQMHSFQPFEMDVNHGYASLNFNHNYGHEKLFDARCALFYFFLLLTLLANIYYFKY
jgi:hypothetical protein